MKVKTKHLGVAMLLIQTILFSGSVYSQDVVPAETVERLRAIYEEKAFAVKSFRGEWLPDASGYLVHETAAGTKVKVPVKYDVADGKRTELVTSKQIAVMEAEGAINIDDYVFSPDGNKMLLTISSKKNDKRNISHWMLEYQTGKLQKVDAGKSNKISPDSKQILFTKEGNLLVYNLEKKKTTLLTTDAVPDSVTYYNAVWSPDGKKVVFVQYDESHVRLRSILVPGDPSYPEVEKNRFARVGGTIESMKIGVVDAEGKEIKWLPIPAPKEGFYLGELDWAGNSNEVLVEQLSRFRDRRDILIANLSDGSLTTIFNESDPNWVVSSFEINTGVEWLDDYTKFLVLSEKDGWRHAYVCSRDGKKQKDITPGDFDIIENIKVDKIGGWLYYDASPKNGTQCYYYRTRLDGKGAPERITPMDQPGYHSYNISFDCKWAFHTYHSVNSPPVIELVNLPEHKVVKVLEDNKALREKTAELSPVEFFQVDIGEGVNIDGWMIKPSDFDPSKKYPVFIYVYGEPHGQTVLDYWGYPMINYHRVIADLGYIVISMDNRGTPCPKGAAWRRAIDGKLGPLSTEEQTAGLKEFGRTRSYVDLSRVGVWGWSGGGSNTLNALFRKPNDYHLGIAVVPKPQPHLYNAWFQEIYMKTREVNPEGYKESAPINYAEGLEGDLLIITGSGETNTHIQIVEGLVDRLIELGKQFDYMVYPNRDHGLREGKGTQLHMRVYMARYLLNHLQPGPR